jgi:hypothetical protein
VQPNYLTPDEQARVDEIDAELGRVKPMAAERRLILARARARQHYAENR